MLLPHEDGLFRMFKCAKRRIQIRVVRTGTKIKHIID
jgi:hypothetical protein